jgi:hypothetical protein
MTDKTNNSLAPVATQPGRLPVNQPAGPSPVRVKLRRVNASLAEPYPPDGEKKVWWKRLKKALGTKSSDFVNASLLELQAAAHLPFGGISEVAINAALALIEGAAPRNEMPDRWLELSVDLEAVSKLVVRRAAHRAAPSPPSDRACRTLP